ncbi:MAG: hypothetical protein IH991_13840 [Planctomycetes bacterium]|nr:hypothetical protein [Planctomycetota bacterium]
MTLKVNTTTRAMGDFPIPIDVFVLDGEGVRYQLHAVQRIRVNPGWTVSKTRLSLNAESDDAGTVSDEFLLFQTSPDHPFDITAATVGRDGVLVDVQKIDPNEHMEDLVVGKTAELQWKAIPRYRVRVSVPTADIKHRERAQLFLQLSHNLTRVGLDVELVPRPRALSVSPTELYLDSDATSSSREFVVTTTGSQDLIEITPPAGIAVERTISLGKKLLKVIVQVDHATWKGEAITIADGRGNRVSVPFRQAK